MDDTGFWAAWGVAASVDWCEPNYLISPFIAEFWNTTSSLLLVLMAWLGAVEWWFKDPRRETRFGLAWAGMALVGVGSVAFHGTLLASAQAMDEMPMIYATLTCLWVALRRRLDGQGEGALTATLFTYGVLFTAAYAVLHAFFPFFLSTYVILVSMIVVRSIRMATLDIVDPITTRMMWVAGGAFLGGFFICWLPEHVFLTCSHPAQQLQLHSLWHTGAAIGSAAWIRGMMYDRIVHHGPGTRVG